MSQVEEILQTGFNTGVLQRFGEEYMISVPTQPIQPPPAPIVNLEDCRINSPTYIPALERKRHLYLRQKRQRRQMKEQIEQQLAQELQKQKQQEQQLTDHDSESDHNQDAPPPDFSEYIVKKQKSEKKSAEDVPESEHREKKPKIRQNSATYIPELERKQQARAKDNRVKEKSKKNKKRKFLNSEENTNSIPDSNEDVASSSKSQRNRKTVSTGSQTTDRSSGSGSPGDMPVASKKKHFSLHGSKGYRRRNSSDSLLDEDYD